MNSFRLPFLLVLALIGALACNESGGKDPVAGLFEGVESADVLEQEGPKTCSLDRDCSPGSVCLGGACFSGCISHLECPIGQVCCEGACVSGDCCQSAECGFRVCADNYCRPCQGDDECGDGSLCCGGLCREGDCCFQGDCDDGRLCISNECIECMGDAECPYGHACCEGACVEGGCKRDPVGDYIFCDVREDCERIDPSMACWSGVCVRGDLLLTANPGDPCDAGNPCLAGLICCADVCRIGDCCTDAECPAHLQCLGYMCRTCQNDQQCGSGKVCCNGTCSVGECCPGAICDDGSICDAYVCRDCVNDTECGNGRVCCGGECRYGDCCDNSDCTGEACVNNYCRACSNHGQCDPDDMCCSGQCVQNAQCCHSTDCAGGQLCSFNQCAPCSTDTDCGMHHVCCSGECRQGNCCDNSDCIDPLDPGKVCTPRNICGSCTSHDQCAGKCCSARCVDHPNACCHDGDCGGGRLCINNSCEPCGADGQCGRGKVCCPPGASDAMCYVGNCCDDSDCGGLICNNYSCEPCRDDSQCNGDLCCYGQCMQVSASFECCTNDHCSTGAVCKNGECVRCTNDGDCPGSQRCCGPLGNERCLSFCRGMAYYYDEETFGFGEFDGTTASDPTCARDNPVANKLCWVGEEFTVTMPYLWVADEVSGGVYRFGATTGQRSGPYPTGVDAAWPVVSGVVAGERPTRLAVDPIRRKVWVANSGEKPEMRAPRSGVARLNDDGSIDCYYGVDGGAKSLAIDSEGNALVGSFRHERVAKIAADGRDTSTDPPTCIGISQPVINTNPYNADIDNSGIMWVQDGTSHLTMFDIDSGHVLGTRATGVNQFAGIAVDVDYVWVPNNSNQSLARVEKRGTAFDTYSISVDAQNVRTSGNYVYVAGGSHGRVVRSSRTSPAFTPIITGQPFTVGVAIDQNDYVWGVSRGGQLDRYNPSTGVVTRMHDEAGFQLSGYGDLTGKNVVDTALAPGIWSVKYDSLFISPRWTNLYIAPNTPNAGTVQARVRSASSLAALGSATFYEVDLSVMPAAIPVGLPNLRYLELELRLRPGPPDGSSIGGDAPNIFVSVDESGSMSITDGTGKSRTQRVKEGLYEVVDALDGTGTRIGIGGFASNSRTILAMGQHDLPTLNNAVSSITNGGMTAMHLHFNHIINALNAGTTSYLDDPSDPDNDSRLKTVVLIGDGLPNQCSGYTNSGEGCADLIERLILELRLNHGIKTYIVGFNFNTDTFNRFADAGGTDNVHDSVNRYFLATSGQELADAFETIASELIKAEGPEIEGVQIEWRPY